ncbi:ABC transporter permease [Sporolactobacillus pectinivorans]|uniref:ABC transporter permease n=1 Tax=Sporolactobacillus pectinivorans TaxID=1591408 RepID=UPI000C25D7CC|nr:ABC transporter permease [Sporolactobacillus pectinivorans]
MKSAWKVIREQLSNFYLIRRLSLYELKSENNNNYLGMLWVILNPTIQIFIYWFVFGYILHRSTRVYVGNGDAVPYVIWLISGIFLWFFLNSAVMEGGRSIYSRIWFIAKMNFPMSTIPSYVIFEKFYQHLMLTGIVVVILQFTQYKISIYMIQLPYFMFAALAFLVSVSLITSTFTTIVRDLQQVLISLMRMMIYLTPFLWAPYNLPAVVQHIMILNPMYYLVEGYRASLLGVSWYGIEHLKYTVYFWGVVILMFIFGSVVHLKFRDHFVDYL